MSKLKMALALVLVVALTAGVAIAGTLAYMTSEQEDINVMTTGKVEIEQLEYERVLDEDGKPVEGVEGEDFTADYGITQSYKLREFTQSKPAYPAFYNNEEDKIAWDEFQQLWNGIGAPGSNELFDDSITNVIDKFVFVKNTGSVDAYFRTLIAIEFPEGLEDKDIHVNMNGNSRYDMLNANGRSLGYATIGGVRYEIFNMTYNEVLKPGEMARPSLLQVFLDPSVTNEKCALFGDTWDILVKSQAVQAEGAASHVSALNKAFGEATLENVAALFGGMLKNPFAVVTVLDENDTLTNADGDVIVLGKNREIDTTGSKLGLDLGTINLDTAYQFEPLMSAEDGAASEYADWHADFVVSVNKDVPAFGIALAGYYDAWCSLNDDKWVMLASDAPIKAGTELRLVETMSEVMGLGVVVPYDQLCFYGNDGIGFLCGAVDLGGEQVYGTTVPELPAGTTLTVELRLYEVENGEETGEYMTTGTYTYTFN